MTCDAAEVTHDMRILLVEDDRKIASFIVEGLNQAGYAADAVINGEDALDLATSNPYDVAVVDVMLPHMDGLTLVGELRRKKIRTPVIILSAKRSVGDRVKGLQTGSDDYLTKPFALSELVARIQALLRRSSSEPQPTRLAAGDLVMDLVTRDVTRGAQRIDLPPREFALLEYLLRNVGRPVSREMILRQALSYTFDPQTNVVEVLVCRVRNKVDDDFQVKLIHTIRGVGYLLKRP